MNFGSEFGKFGAFDHECADDRERDAAVELDRGTLSQFGHAGHGDFDNVSALQAVFRRAGFSEQYSAAASRAVVKEIIERRRYITAQKKSWIIYSVK